MRQLHAVLSLSSKDKLLTRAIDPPAGVGLWHVERNHVKILKNAKDRGRTTPSVVRFDPESEHRYEVGAAAIAKETQPVGNTIRSIKRLMGQKCGTVVVFTSSGLVAV